MRYFPLLFVLGFFLALPIPSGSPQDDQKDDCDECVIVMAAPAPGGKAPEAAAAIPEALANTLWGLFCVARPRKRLFSPA
jgi:hypothetical protein